MVNMDVDNQVFQKVCKLLDSNDINFWVCHGTLLGIVREGRLLPWDHDIDFAVWASEVSKKKIVDMFVDHGFKQELVFGDMDCLHFYGENKKIDISFYRVKDSIASIRWVAPSNSMLLNLYLYCLQIIWTESIKSVKLSSNILKRMIQVLMNKFLIVLKYFLSSKLKKDLYKHATRLMRYTGYSYPVNLMTFKEIKYCECVIQIPIDSEKCLELTYGEDWRVAKEKYIWHEEASNLIS